MLDCMKKRNDLLGETVVKNLKARQMDAYYVQTKEEALKKALELIPADHSIGWGGSVSVGEIGLREALAQRGNPILDRDNAKTPEEKDLIQHQILSCGTFLMSSNAVTEKGELFNIDGAANRVAALCYGPKSVVMIVGINKVVADLEAAYSRVRHYVAPVNAARFCDATPCSKTGTCADCLSSQTICCQMVATRYSRIPNRIKVILVNETLGM